MADFVKFPSIQQDWVAPAFLYDDFHDSTFVVTEKIDGANLQLYFVKDRPWRVGKRTSFLKPGAKFFNVWQVLERYAQQIQRLADHVAKERIELRLFGELFGCDVIRRIDYRTSGDLRFYQMDRQGERTSFRTMEVLFEDLGLSDLLVPVRAKTSFDQAMALEPAAPSLLNPTEEAEGYVVAGYEKTFPHAKNGTPFLCKIKNPAFADVEGGPGERPEYFPITRYLNRNRIFSVSSKHGAFDDLRRGQEYVQLVLDEAEEDYRKDHGEPPAVPAETFRKQVQTLIYTHVREQVKRAPES